jgi:outer membrane protein assembly factor BamD (BamD/ComL family)
LKLALAAAFALALGAALACPPARAQQGTLHVTADSVIFERFQSLRFKDGAAEDDVDDVALPPADEIALSRAAMLLRSSRVEQAIPMLEDLWRRHPDSPHIATTTASAYLRAGRPNDALKVLDASDKAVREARARAKLAAPAVDPLAAMRAHLLLAMGRRKDAIPWMVEAAAEPHGEAFALQRQLLEWAETADVGPEVVAAAERRADSEPKDVSRALLAAEIECRAGKMQAALTRLARAEPQGMAHGQLAQILGGRLAADAQGAALAAPVWLELARGPYDPSLRAAALRRLLNPAPVVTSGGKVRTLITPVSASDLEAAWRSLPAGEERARLGLDLLQALRARGDTAAAQRVATELSKSGAPGQFSGPVDVEAGLLALGQGNLDEAGKRLERARTQSVDDEARERAEFAQAEVLFYSCQFDSALVSYDRFATAHPLSPLANEALARAFLLEPDPGQAPGQAPGLAFYAEARRQWEAAATWAHQAEGESFGSDRLATAMPRSDGAAPESLGLANPVRANALLLLSRVEEARAVPAEARLAALAVADSLPGDRLAPVARKRVGDLDLARGNKEAALAQYEDLLARYPRSWLAAEVRRQVTELRSQLRAGRTP